MKIYRKLLPYLKPHVGLFAIASLCMVAASLLEGISLGMLAPLIDVVVLNRPIHLPSSVPSFLSHALQALQAMGPLMKLNLVVGLALLLFLLKNLAIFGQTYLMSDVAMRFLRDVRNAIYQRYQQLSLDFFSGERTGDLISRITNDVAVLHNAFTEGINDLVYHSARIIVFGAMAVAIDWRLALVVLFLIPSIGYPMVRIGKALRKLGIMAQERMSDLNSHLIETLQGIRIVKAFTAEEREAARFGSVNQQYYKASVKTVKRREALAGITELIGIAAGLLVLEVGGRAVLRNELSPGTFALFVGSLLSLLQPIKKLSRLHATNQQALVAAKRVVEILETRPSVTEKPDAVALPRFREQIRFEDVWFRYDGPFVLRGVNLTVHAGEVVAIAGASGGGKTTLVNLISRFYDPTRGRVTLSGVDLRDVTLHSLRAQVGLVTQDPFLFHDTVRANIAFGNTNATFEEVEQAAKAANADDFIRRFSKGYESSVGDLGIRLSGGERQRLAIARAILKDPPILILDEATSQLDSESEAFVQEALERLMRNRTVFVIAHRLSTIRNVDRIIVLDEGRVAEVGSHEQLLQGSPVYRRLYELQVAG